MEEEEKKQKPIDSQVLNVYEFAKRLATISDSSGSRLANVLMDIFKEEQKKLIDEGKYLSNLRLNSKLQQIIDYKLLPEEKEMFRNMAQIIYKDWIMLMQNQARQFNVVNLMGGKKDDRQELSNN